MHRRTGRLAAAALLIASGGGAAPALAAGGGGGAPASGPHPHGGSARGSLTTHESGCVEVAVPRAVTVAGARALVPARYVPSTTTVPLEASRFQMWDYVCDEISVDRRHGEHDEHDGDDGDRRGDDDRRDRRTQVSIGAVALASRDGLAVEGAFYVTSIATDDARLAARWRGFGLPARFVPALAATVSAPGGSPVAASFAVPGPDEHTVSSVAETAPTQVPASGGPVLYHQGPGGETVLRYANESLGSVPAAVTADYRAHRTVAPIVVLPRLVQILGVTFPEGLTTGSWTTSVTRSR